MFTQTFIITFTLTTEDEEDLDEIDKEESEIEIHPEPVVPCYQKLTIRPSIYSQINNSLFELRKEKSEVRRLNPNAVVTRRCHVVVAGHVFVVKWQHFANVNQFCVFELWALQFQIKGEKILPSPSDEWSL